MVHVIDNKNLPAILLTKGCHICHPRKWQHPHCIKEWEAWSDHMAANTRTQSLCPEPGRALSLGHFSELNAKALCGSGQGLISLSSPLTHGSSLHKEDPLSLGFQDQQPLLQILHSATLRSRRGCSDRWIVALGAKHHLPPSFGGPCASQKQLEIFLPVCAVGVQCTV